MKVINLSEKHSVLGRFLADLRDVNIQKDPLRFRRNLERIGEIQAYEISKTLNYQTVKIQTPLGKAPTALCSDKIVLGTIFRAGLPHHQGFLNYFDTDHLVGDGCNYLCNGTCAAVQVVDYLVAGILTGVVIESVDVLSDCSVENLSTK